MWLDLEVIILSETSQTKMSAHPITSCLENSGSFIFSLRVEGFLLRERKSKKR